MKIKTGEYEVLYSVTVIGIQNVPIIIEFPSERASLKFVINFTRDNTQSNSIWKTIALDEKTLEILLINFAGSLGTGNLELIEVGFIGNRKIFLNYRVYAIKDISNTLHYTFYLGKEGSNVTG